MSQPPDDPFYNNQTENASFPPQWQGQGAQQNPPRFPPPQGPQNAPNFTPPPQGYPQQNPAQNYPGQPYPAQQPYPPQGSRPANQPPNGPFGPPPQQGPNSFFANSTQPAGNYQGQPPERKRSGMGVVFAIIAIVLVLLLVVGGVGYYLATHAQSTSSSPSASTTPGSVTPVATSSNGSTTGTVGQPVQAGSIWTVTLTRTDTSTAGTLAPPSGDEYLEISLSLKNISSSSQLLSSLEFSLTDANNGKYTVAVTDLNVKPLAANVAAGQSQSGQVAFTVPTSQHHFLLAFTYNLVSGSTASVNWPITV